MVRHRVGRQTCSNERSSHIVHVWTFYAGEVAKWLRATKGLSKARIGDFLSSEKPLNKSVLTASSRRRRRRWRCCALRR